MKFIYTLLAIIAMAAFASCTDTDPQPITTIDCEASVAEVTPAWITFALKVNSESNDIIKEYCALIINSNKEIVEYGYFRLEDGQDAGSTAYATIDFDYYYGDGEFKTGETYTYQIATYAYLSDDANRIVLEEGTFTIPTVEEYLADMSVEVTMETSMITNNAAQLTITRPNNIKWNNYGITALVSKSSDFTDSMEIQPSYNSVSNNLMYNLTELEEDTQYFVKLHGNFTLITPSGYEAEMKNYDLKVKPDSFKTLSNADIIINSKCTVKERFVLDNRAGFIISLPKGWSFYKEYKDDSPNYQVLYSTDKEFNTYKVLTSKSIGIYMESLSFELYDLTPSTEYFFVVRGDFTFNDIDKDFFNFDLQCENGFTTRHANQIEMIDGHGVVDLGLSVKWATENVTNGNETVFAWPDVSGVKDIAGTEYDIAKKYWGGSWQMPSKEQFIEVLEKCNVVDCGNSIFIIGTTENYISMPIGDYYFHYWTSTASSNYRNHAVYFGGNKYDLNYYITDKSYSELFYEAEITNKYLVRAVTKK